MRSIIRWVMIAILITLALDAGVAPAAAQTGPVRTDTLRVDLAEVARIASERSAVVELEGLALIKAQSEVAQNRLEQERE